jgi:hypothetical protein
VLDRNKRADSIALNIAADTDFRALMLRNVTKTAPVFHTIWAHMLERARGFRIRCSKRSSARFLRTTPRMARTHRPVVRR